MRPVAPASLCSATLAALALALLAGCGGTVPTAPTATGTSSVSGASGGWGRPSTPATVIRAVNPWPGLQAQVGRYPTEGTDYLRTGPLADRLRGLLGSTNYPVLLDNLAVSSPLRQEGAMLYITGNRPHAGGIEAAAVVIHPATDAVRVWLLTGGEEWDVQDQGAPKILPADVVTMMENARR
ncbi:MAG: hypothetical protein ACK41V_15355 [Acidovorax sp.]|uniref:hypothetical protein n=1 Tax=Acidovorax sp. TaxID=1872122 RepID=UPI00391940E3